MTKRSQLSAAPYRLGEIRFFTAGANPMLVDPNSGRWLRTGYLTNYSSVYDPLLADNPGLGIRALPTREAVFVSNNMGYGAKLFSIGGNYVFVAASTSGNLIETKSGVNTQMAGTFGSPTSYFQGLYAVTKLNATTLIFSGVPKPGQTGLTRNISLGGSCDNGTGIAVDVVWTYCASNGAGHAVAFINGASTNGANMMATTTDGAAYTLRTGAGGNSDTVQGCYWSPCAGKYLTVCGVAANVTKMNSSLDGYTQTACALPAGVVFNAGDTWERYHASSPTTTLIALKDGRILRTTDGAAFVVVDPAASSGYTLSASGVLGYDSVNSRFLMATGIGFSGRPTFLYSDDQGLTWKVSCAFEDFEQGNEVTTGVIGTVNGKLLVGMKTSASSALGHLFDMSAQPMNAPQYVGTFRNAYQQASASYLALNAYIRVKN